MLIIQFFLVQFVGNATKMLYTGAIVGMLGSLFSCCS